MAPKFCNVWNFFSNVKQALKKERLNSSRTDVLYYCSRLLIGWNLNSKIPKIIWIMWHTFWVLLISVSFYRGLATFSKWWNTDTDCIMIRIFFPFFESLKIVLMNTVTILMMSVKMAPLHLFKIKVFWGKVYDIINFIHDVTNKIGSCDSNYIVDVQCHIQQFFGGASFLISVARRKTVVQLGSLGQHCKPSPVGPGAKPWKFLAIFCSE